VHQHALNYKADHVLIERHNGSESLIFNIHEHTSLHWDGIKPLCSKEARMDQETSTIEQGRIFLPQKAEWLEPFRAEVTAFPEGEFDDQVDSLSQFLYWLRLGGPERPCGRYGLGNPGGPVGFPPKKVSSVGSGSRVTLCGPRRSGVFDLRGIDLGSFRL
jgi:hypothetical protein